MNDKTLELLTKLSDKFGTTVEHLWEVMVKQAVIVAFNEILLAVGMIAVFICLYRFVRAKTKVPEKTPEDKYPNAEWEDEGAVLAWIAIGLSLIVVTLQVYTATTTGLTVLFNPEYWALKQFLH